MAYTTPRTWDGTETTNVATYLQAMRANNDALWARLPSVNKGFEAARVENSGAGGQKIWRYQHRLQYLHYHFDCTTSTIDDVSLYVSTSLSSLGTAVINHGGSYSNGDIMTSAGDDGGSAADLSSLTVGTWYFIVVRIELSGSGKLWVRNLEESSKA